MEVLKSAIKNIWDIYDTTIKNTNILKTFDVPKELAHLISVVIELMFQRSSTYINFMELSYTDCLEQLNKLV